ncbi:zinc finger protein 707-like [Oncorhynchus keta]|uniref:zinc finger protein 707-like n=1 Tax=Oncorhynchus keta TaxID=8018 RepID=UPI00227A4DE1|nr:zinc finger protein 707-like [Oncorhynchus keta]
MMKAHILCHLTEQPHPCPQCDNFFRTVYDLSHQLVTSVPRTPGQPGFCITTRWRTVTTPLADSDHTFEDCNKTPHHLKLRSEDTPSFCPDRGKGFLWPDRLTLHRRTHVTEPKSGKIHVPAGVHQGVTP